MDATEFDLDDPREAAILETLRSEGMVLSRADLPWPSGEPRELNLLGVVAGEEGPELFQASAWVSHGTYMNVREQFRGPLEDALARFLPGTGDGVAARGLDDRGDEGATADHFGGRAKYLGRNANQTVSVHALRVAGGGDGEQALAFAVTTRAADGSYSCETRFRANFSEVRDWAQDTFGRSGPRP